MSDREKLERSQWIGVGVMLAGLVLFYLSESIAGLGVLGFFMVLGGGFYSFTTRICPHCGEYLGRHGIPKFCPHCGKEIT